MNEKVIWDFFYNKFKNPYGVAALMGNLYVESKFNPKNLQSSYRKKFGLTDEEYTAAVDNETYSSFILDGAGYGLAQWTYWSRKQDLYNYAKKSITSIGDLGMQLNYIWIEIQLYKTVFKAIKEATSIREASDVICERYEKPANQSESGKKNRADYGEKFFKQFYSESNPNTGENESNSASNYVLITTDRVNIRAGNDKKYPVIFQTRKNELFKWIATAENGWHAIETTGRVAWVSGEFSKIKKK